MVLKRVWLMAVFALTVCMMQGWAEDEDNMEWVQGTVKVTKDAKGEITGVTIVSSEWDDDDKEVQVVYNVNLDATGKKLGKELAGKEVDANGAVVNKGTKKAPQYWITVKSYEEVKPYTEEDNDK